MSSKNWAVVAIWEAWTSARHPWSFWQTMVSMVGSVVFEGEGWLDLGGGEEVVVVVLSEVGMGL